MDPETLAFYVFLGILLVVLIREIRQWQIASARIGSTASRAQQERASIAAMFENIPKAIEELRNMHMDMRLKKATPEQLKPIEDRINTLEKINTWRFILQPAAEYFLPTLKQISKWFK